MKMAMMHKMQAVLDTSAIIFGVENKIDPINVAKLEFKCIVIPQCVIDELEEISKKPSKRGAYAKFALELIKRHGIKIAKSGKKPADAYMLAHAPKGSIIITNDAKLIKMLKSKNIMAVRLAKSGSIG